MKTRAVPVNPRWGGVETEEHKTDQLSKPGTGELNPVAPQRRSYKRSGPHKRAHLANAFGKYGASIRRPSVVCWAQTGWGEEDSYVELINQIPVLIPMRQEVGASR